MEEELDISALSPIAKDTTSRTPFKTVNDLEARLQVSGPPTEMGCGWLCIVSGNGAFVCPGRGYRSYNHSEGRGSLSPHHAGSYKEVPVAHKPALLLYLGKLNAPGDQELTEENLNLQIRLSVGEAPTPSNQRAAFSTPDTSLVQAAGRGRTQGVFLTTWKRVRVCIAGNRNEPVLRIARGGRGVRNFRGCTRNLTTRCACAEGEFSLLFAVPNSCGERLPILEATQGQSLRQSPTDATSGRKRLNLS